LNTGICVSEQDTDSCSIHELISDIKLLKGRKEIVKLGSIAIRLHSTQ